MRVLRFPRGVALLITPWNFPIAIPTWKLAPALQAGNAVVIKPASQALRVAKRLVEHLDLGDVVQVAEGGGAVAQALLDARPDAVSFTGSTATGRSIAERLAGSFVPLQLEMGGKNGVYVSEAADPALAAKVVLGGAMGYAGQKCTATSLAFVHERAADAVTAALTRAGRRARRRRPGRRRHRGRADDRRRQARRGRRADRGRRGPRRRRAARLRRCSSRRC